MKAVLLAGGLGTRFSEETDVRPKPMIEIGGRPILWHIMKIYSSHGINDFIVCLGYKGYVIKEYFSNYFVHQSNVTFDMRENKMHVLHKNAEPWTVTLEGGAEADTNVERVETGSGLMNERIAAPVGRAGARIDTSPKALRSTAARDGLRPSPLPSRRAGSAPSISRATASPAFRKSRAATAALSTADFSFFRPRWAGTSRATRPSGKKSL
jgi:hypothetical protein